MTRFLRAKKVSCFRNTIIALTDNMEVRNWCEKYSISKDAALEVEVEKIARVARAALDITDLVASLYQMG